MSKIRPSITGENIWNDGRRAPFYRCCYDYYSSIHGAALTALAGMLHHLDSFRLLSSLHIDRDLLLWKGILSQLEQHRSSHHSLTFQTEISIIIIIALTDSRRNIRSLLDSFFFSIKGTMKFSTFFHWTLWTFLMIKDGSIVNRNGKFCI